MEKETQLEVVQKEFSRELKNPKNIKILLSTVFKGFPQQLMEQCIFEAMMRGYTIKDFLQKDVYAIKFHNNRTGIDEYSLITSIDKIRKIAMRSGLAGKSAPEFKQDDKGIISCTIIIKRAVAGVIGDYAATAYFDEYDTKKNLWITKPHTMIAKVAEAQALRSAFPEEMTKLYVEEEFQKSTTNEIEEENFDEYETKLKEAKSVEELKSVWASLPQKGKTQFKGLAEELKNSFKKETPKIETKKDDTKKI
jgi:phage recombination protein Bet